MSLIDHLRASTAEQHARVEQAFTGHFSLDSVDHYTDLLSAFYGFVTPWETLVRQQCDPEIRVLMDSRWRKPALEADLRHFGIDPTNLKKSPRLPLFSRDGLLGSVYVMEGSRLGGQKIARALEHTLGLTTGLGRSYFIGDGAETGVRWRQFIAELNRLGESRSARDAVDGAMATFECLAGWFRDRKVVSRF